MTIRNKQFYMESLWDWGFLDECFGWGIKVSDLDGIVERNGHLLFIEAKSLGKDVPRGQRYMFRELSLSGFTVLVLWGEPNKPISAAMWLPLTVSQTEVIAISERHVQQFVGNWYRFANLGHKRIMEKKAGWESFLLAGSQC